MELLRFATAGSVDDGKSTLIGRLLFDTKAIFEDQLEAVERASIQMAADYVNPGQTNYGAAKSGIATLTQVMAKELVRYGVRANEIAPAHMVQGSSVT